MLALFICRFAESATTASSLVLSTDRALPHDRYLGLHCGHASLVSENVYDIGAAVTSNHEIATRDGFSGHHESPGLLFSRRSGFDPFRVREIRGYFVLWRDITVRRVACRCRNLKPWFHVKTRRSASADRTARRQFQAIVSNQ